MISNGSATTSQRNVLTLRDAWRSPLSSASGHWRRFRTSGALVAFEGRARLRFLRSPSSPSTKFARNNCRLANPPRNAALAEGTLASSMLSRITITRAWSDNDVAQLTFEVCDGVSVFRNEAYATRYAEPYMNPDGYLVRWQLISIHDVYALFDEALDPRGTEVYSKLRTVRMRPEYRWRPKRGRAHRASK